jgi:hypothetical protein
MKKMTAHIKYITLVLLFVTALGFSQSSKPFEAWIPTGWKLIGTATGDLNLDGVDDAVLILEETNPANLKSNEGLGASTLNLNPRRLLILFKMPSGYRKAFSSDKLLPSEHDENSPCLEDPLGDITVFKERLLINLKSSQSCGSYGVTLEKFTFRLENTRFRLIGYDHSEFSRSSGEKSEYSVNYSTGKKKIITGLNEFEESKPSVSWKRIPGKREFYLDEIALDCDSTDEPGCGWHQ